MASLALHSAGYYLLFTFELVTRIHRWRCNKTIFKLQSQAEKHIGTS